MLDRYQLRYFLAVIDQGNFSRAAEACNVAQPTLSVGIAKLERTIGQILFIRSNQRIQLTPAGDRFLAHARRIEREFNLVLQEMGTPATMPFRLGILGSIPSAITARAIAEVGQQGDHRLELVFGTERELVGHLAKGRIDMALTLVERGPDRFLERALLTEGYALALPATHRLADEAEILADDLAGETMIVRRHCEALSETSRYFTERGVRPHFALRSTNEERVLEMIAAGLGMTIMPDCFQHQGVGRPKLAGFPARRTIGWMAAHANEALLATPLPLMEAIERQLSDSRPARM